MIDTEALRKKVIDLAIQGKLTEQLPSDGDAETLYAKIQEEKSTILDMRGGRKDKSIKEDDEEKPFEIPDNWKWIRFGEVGLFKKGPFGSALTKSMFVPKSDRAVKVYEQQHAIKKDASLGTYYITREYFESNMEGFEVKGGDILVSCAGTIGETYIMPEEIEQGIINQALMRVTLVDSIVDEFFLYYFDSNLKTSARNESNGMAIKNIPPFDVMKNWFFPLPPIDEQNRIVDKINKVLTLVDIIDDLQVKYINDLVVLKSKIIDAGIRGKLTEQLPEDGDAEDLYAQIQEEKAKLIKEGKIKKEKPLPEINAEEIPFEIPKNWKWIRLGDYCLKVTDQVASGSFASLRENVKVYKELNYAIMVKTADFANDFTENLTYTDKHGYEFLVNSNLFGGELILTNIGSVGKCFIVPELDMKMTLAPNLIMIRLNDNELRDYLYYFILSEIGLSELEAISTGVAVKKFNKTDLKTILIPIPPIEEQKRIVNVINNLLEIFNRIKSI
ncbi:MAG: restriction endonuclease subunit S [Lachnospiraceae bacterium]|nr:restriction endonuclease subunit S [Lachnospiraceae bacterium]